MPNIQSLSLAQNVQVEWQRYTLDTLTIGTNPTADQTFSIDQLHDEVIVPAISTFRTGLANLATAPAGAVQPAAGIAGWAALAFKNLPNPANQNQWAGAWWLQLAATPNLNATGVPQATNPRGQFFHVTAQNGYIEANAQAQNPQAVTYGNLLTAIGQAREAGIANWLTKMILAPGQDPDTSVPATNAQAMQQMGAALLLAEVHRNNLTLPVNLAMIDLMKAGVFTVRDFIDKLHPMAQGGAMADIGNGTAGAQAGARSATRTRQLETTVLMYWLRLLDDRFNVRKAGQDITFTSAIKLSDVRNVPSHWDRDVTVSGRSLIQFMLQERLLQGLLKQNRLDYFG